MDKMMLTYTEMIKYTNKRAFLQFMASNWKERSKHWQMAKKTRQIHASHQKPVEIDSQIIPQYKQMLKYILLVACLCFLTLQQDPVVILSSNPSNTIIVSPTVQTAVPEYFLNIYNPNPLNDSSSLWLWKSPANINTPQRSLIFKAQFASYCNMPAILSVICQSNLTVNLNGNTISSSQPVDGVITYNLETLKCGVNILQFTVPNPSSSNISGLIFKVTQDQTTCFDCIGFNTFFNKTSCKCQCIKGCNCLSPSKLYTWRGYPDCFCNCTTFLQCPAKQYYNTNTCACQCNPIYCQEKFAQSKSTCLCQCKKIVKCTAPLVWNSKTCSCECLNVTACNTKITFWNAKTCICECIKKPNCIRGIQILNLTTCVCDCTAKNTTCPDNMFWNSTTCACQCTTVLNCTARIQVFNPRTCICECSPKPRCLPPFVLNTTNCLCQCATVLNCSDVQNWNPKTCKCDCKVKPVCNASIHNTDLNLCNCACKVNLTCLAEVQVFNTTLCTCQCVDPLKVYNRTRGTCDCKAKLNCAVLTHVWNIQTCTCDCKTPTCQTQANIFDSKTCKCSCSPPLNCTTAQRANISTCACDCIKQESDCKPTQTYNADTCLCQLTPP